MSLAQLAPELGDKEKNLETMADAVKKADSDIVIFGELFLTGYMCRDNLPKLAETLGGPSVKRVIDIAQEHDAHIVFGMPERDTKVAGQVYNSSILAMSLSLYPETRQNSMR